jgi:hypothetical protein
MKRRDDVVPPLATAEPSTDETDADEEHKPEEVDEDHADLLLDPDSPPPPSEGMSSLILSGIS